MRTRTLKVAVCAALFCVGWFGAELVGQEADLSNDKEYEAYVIHFPKQGGAILLHDLTLKDLEDAGVRVVVESAGIVYVDGKPSKQVSVRILDRQDDRFGNTYWRERDSCPGRSSWSDNLIITPSRSVMP